MKKLISILAMTMLVGCATDKDYYEAIQARIKADQATSVARAEAERAKYQALASMANSGGDSAKVAAVFAFMSNNANNTMVASAPAIQPAPTPVDRVLQVLQVTNSIVTPWIAPVMSYKNAQVSGQVAIAQSQSNRDIFLGSYNALAQVAGNIPQPTTTTTTNTTTTSNTTTTTNSVGRDGVVGSGTLTRNCTAGSGSTGAPGGSGGAAAVSPATSASGVLPNTMTTFGGNGSPGGTGGNGGGLTC